MNIGFPKTSKINFSVKSAAAMLGLLLSTSATHAITLAESTFDPGADFDGWTGVECSNPGLCPVDGGGGPLAGDKFFHDSLDGQPFEAGAGNLEIVDPASGTTGLYNAPSPFTSAIAPGTVLELDFKVNGIGGGYDNDGTGVVPLFYVEDSAIGAGAVYLLPEAAIPIGPWLEYSIPIVPNGDPAAGPGQWFAFGGGNLSPIPDDGTGFGFAFGGDSGNRVLRIWGELTKDADDADGTQLDNVRITVVPIPAALPMMISALAAFGLWRRKAA